jgi:hypothetical protein
MFETLVMIRNDLFSFLFLSSPFLFLSPFDKGSASQEIRHFIVLRPQTVPGVSGAGLGADLASLVY